MDFIVWIVIFIINTFVLITTVLVPTDTTAITMIPILLSTSTVIIEDISKNNYSGVLQKVLMYVLCGISGLFILWCAFVSYGCEMDASLFLYIFKKETILNGIKFSYNYFWIPVASWCTVVPIFSIIYEAINNKYNKKRRDKSFAEHINN